MKQLRDLSLFDPALRGAVLTVGNFDGVHLGHRRILRTARALANVSSAAVIAMTFDPHPLAVLTPDHAPARLSPWEEKVNLLAAAGADVVVRLKTDRALLSLAPETFIQELLIRQIHPSYIVEGPDFAFGKNRTGNVDTLRRASAKGGFQVHIVEPYRLNLGDGGQVTVSSTLIRRCLARGRVAQAAACLGRPYALIGEVVRGAGDGRKLGYPTINLNLGEQLIPAEGVYAGRVHPAPCTTEAPPPGDRSTESNDEPQASARAAPRIARDPNAPAPADTLTAAVSIGRRPTLGGESLVVEAFILDATGDWYGRRVRLELIDFVRHQERFDNRETLTAQIARDIETVRRIARENTT